MTYRCVATSVAGFVQQLAVAYLAHGYWFYVTGVVPPGKDPLAVDRKIIDQYGIDVSKYTRCRRKRAGLANVQYLRHDRSFVILATHGEHPFFAAEANQIRDARRQPVPFHGYSIGFRRSCHAATSHASVRIAQMHYRKLKRRFEEMALDLEVEEFCRELRALEFEPYAPVRDQLRAILRAINRRRLAAGLETLPREAVGWRRTPVKPFE